MESVPVFFWVFKNTSEVPANKKNKAPKLLETNSDFAPEKWMVGILFRFLLGLNALFSGACVCC